MRAQALNSITSAAEVFADARRQLQAAINTANDLGLAVPDSFPDAIDHLEDWATSADAEARDLLHAVGPLELSTAGQPPVVLETGSVSTTVVTRAANERRVPAKYGR
jgi:hypothetical protein